jgi:DNA polymerase III subunit delta
MFTDLNSFSKHIQEFPNLCLIIGKDIQEAINIVLNKGEGKVKIFEGDNFDFSFYTEIASLSLFDEKRFFYIRNCDKLSPDEKKNLLFSIKNCPFSFLFSATSPVFLKEIKERGGIILQLPEEKPWQKKKRLQVQLKEKATSCGYDFSKEGIDLLMDWIGEERDCLEQELEKLMCYTLHKKNISASDVQALCTPQNKISLWSWGEAIFQHNFLLSHKIAKALLDEGNSLFILLSHLRNQFRTLIEMHSHYKENDTASLVEKFPYLKGNILSKKIEELRKNRPSLLKRGLYLLFDAELKGKSSYDSLLVLELFLGNYCDPYFIAQFTGAGR